MSEVKLSTGEIASLISAASEPLGLFPSVIKCGEPWTPTCQHVLDQARQAITALGALALADAKDRS